MTKRTTQLIAVNERGHAIGEDRHGCKLTDREVELMRTMHEQGIGLTALAKGFEITKASVWRIVTYRARAQTPARWVERPVRA